VQESILQGQSLLSASVRGVALSVALAVSSESRARLKPFDFISMIPSLKLVWLPGLGEHEAEEEGQLEVVSQLWLWI